MVFSQPNITIKKSRKNKINKKTEVEKKKNQYNMKDKGSDQAIQTYNDFIGKHDILSGDTHTPITGLS